MTRSPALTLALALIGLSASLASGDDRPNIVLAIADDWSWPHAGAYDDTLVDLEQDPDQVKNVAADASHARARADLRARRLAETGDPRAVEDDDRWDRYPYFGGPKSEVAFRALSSYLRAGRAARLVSVRVPIRAQVRGSRTAPCPPPC